MATKKTIYTVTVNGEEHTNESEMKLVKYVAMWTDLTYEEIIDSGMITELKSVKVKVPTKAQLNAQYKRESKAITAPKKAMLNAIDKLVTVVGSTETTRGTKIGKLKEFYTAHFGEINGTNDMIRTIIAEAKKHGIKVDPLLELIKSK